MTVRARAIAVEAVIVVLLGAVLAAGSVGLLLLGGARPAGLGAGDVLSASVAGVVVAVIIRVATRLHRRWRPVIGGFTAAALLCALAALAGALVMLLPSECPGAMFTQGRCGIKDAAAWGNVAGLATALNFAAAGLFLMLLRLVRGLVRGGATQIMTWTRTVKGVRHRDAGRRTRPAPRGPQDPKGRPTPRRADAERARRRARAST